MKVQQILTNAIYESLQDRKFQKIVDGGYLLIALNYLNEILDEWKDLIPYPSKITFTDVDSLQNSTFTEVDSVMFVINRSASALRELSVREFRQYSEVIDLVGYPNAYYFDQLNQTIAVYPSPSQNNYSFIVDGRIAMIQLGQFDNIPVNMPAFMRSALTYEIAFRLAANYGIEWDGKKEALRTSLKKSLMDKKDIDMTPIAESVFGMPNCGRAAPFPSWYYMSGGQ